MAGVGVGSGIGVDGSGSGSVVEARGRRVVQVLASGEEGVVAIGVKLEALLVVGRIVKLRIGVELGGVSKSSIEVRVAVHGATGLPGHRSGTWGEAAAGGSRQSQWMSGFQGTASPRGEHRCVGDRVEARVRTRVGGLIGRARGSRHLRGRGGRLGGCRCCRTSGRDTARRALEAHARLLASFLPADA